MSLYLVRARLRDDASVRALAPLLMPADGPARASASHRLVWSLMPGDADATRDFLWREEGPGRFMLLARRAPAPSTLFDVDHTPFAPELSPDDRLAFVLRANPTVSVPGPRGVRGKRADVVMRALKPLPAKRAADDDVCLPTRATERSGLIKSAGTEWLEQQGARHGFGIETLEVDGYEPRRIARDGARPIAFATLDFAGVLAVRDPAAFMAALAAGFGRGRAFGCGLMLIRRAREG